MLDGLDCELQSEPLPGPRNMKALRCGTTSVFGFNSPAMCYFAKASLALRSTALFVKNYLNSCREWIGPISMMKKNDKSAFLSSSVRFIH